MKKTTVYDLPMRYFHWLFATLSISAYLIASSYDDESSIFPYHMMLGFLLVFLIIFRIVWGFIGSRHARFSSFSLHPRDLIQIGQDLVRAKTKIYPGHNPASSWAAILMMTLILGLGFTCFMMSQNINSEFYDDIHELLANSFMIVVALHVAGVIFHSIRHRDNIGMSMLHGQKENLSETVGIENSHARAGVVLLLLFLAFAYQLNQGYNAKSRTLSLFGTTFNLGEAEDDDEHEQHPKKKQHNDDDHD